MRKQPQFLHPNSDICLKRRRYVQIRDGAGVTHSVSLTFKQCWGLRCVPLVPDQTTVSLPDLEKRYFLPPLLARSGLTNLVGVKNGLPSPSVQSPRSAPFSSSVFGTVSNLAIVFPGTVLFGKLSNPWGTSVPRRHSVKDVSGHLRYGVKRKEEEKEGVLYGEGFPSLPPHLSDSVVCRGESFICLFILIIFLPTGGGGS